MELYPGKLPMNKEEFKELVKSGFSVYLSNIKENINLSKVRVEVSEGDVSMQSDLIFCKPDIETYFFFTEKNKEIDVVGDSNQYEDNSNKNIYSINDGAHYSGKSVHNWYVINDKETIYRVFTENTNHKFFIRESYGVENIKTHKQYKITIYEW